MAEKFFFTTGAKRDLVDIRDRYIAGITLVGAVLPKQVFRIFDPFSAKNQYSLPSCTSQAQAHHKERQEQRKSSARFIMALTKQLEGNTNFGAYTRDTFSVVQKIGICEDRFYPEPNSSMKWEEYIDTTKIPENCYEDASAHKSASYWRVGNDTNELKTVLLQYKNSVVCSMEWFKEFNTPNNGLLPSNFNNTVGGHAVDLVGFDDFKEYFIFKNSWGNGWGDNGHFYMPYNIFNKVIWDLWCSLDIPVEMPVDNYYGEKRTWATYILERSFAFSPWIRNKINRLPNNREIKGLAYGKWSADTVFSGKTGEFWLSMTKPAAMKAGLVDKSENLIK